MEYDQVQGDFLNYLLEDEFESISYKIIHI